MKRMLLLLYILLLSLLSGCGGSLFSSRRDMEHLRPIQTISFDRSGDGVVMGVSSGIGPNGYAPLVMKCASAGIEPAIARLQSYSPEDELFYAHVRFILLGESMADGSLAPLLDWVERSPSMRMDAAMILVNGSASGALTDATGETTDITERLASLEREEHAHGQHIYSLREVASSLLERGGALCLAIRSEPSDDVIYTESEAAAAVVPQGYAVLREGKPAVYLTAEESLGAELLEGSVNGALAIVDGVVLELFSDGAEVSGLWNETGELTGLLICCELEAGILERSDGASSDPEKIGDDLSSDAESWLAASVSRSQEMGCDYLDLRGSVLKNAPLRFGPDDFSAVFSDLPVTVSVHGAVNRSYDLPNRE